MVAFLQVRGKDASVFQLLYVVLVWAPNAQLVITDVHKGLDKSYHTEP